MIVFKNSGEMDLRAISQFGINVKESSNPIGFFGTGLKYALAVLMRSNHRVIIRSGEACCVIGKQTDEFRGKEFEFVTATINGSEPQLMGFTTELGKQWPMWAAYRELACNCMDEGGEAYHAADDTPFDGVAGQTSIFIMGEEFECEHAERSKTILQDAPDVVSGNLEIRLRGANDVYYRGIRVHALNAPALFNYNLLSGVTLTEDRTANSSPMHYIAKGILSCGNESVIEKAVLAPEGAYENGLDFHGWASTSPSEEFLNVIGRLVKDKFVQINPTALRVWREATGLRADPTRVELSKMEFFKLNKAVAFVEKHGYEVSQYTINVVESLGGGTLAMAHDNQITLTRKLFNIGGATKLASCLIEEFIHLKHGYGDMTREMQTHLFELVVSLYEEIQGEAL